MAYTDKTYFLTKISADKLKDLMKDEEGVEQESYLTNAIKAADDKIDSYIRKVATVPLDPVPDAIKQASYDIASYNLHDRIQYNDIPEWVKVKYDGTIKWLENIAAGKVLLNAEQKTDQSEVLQISETPIFTRTIF
jgi:phage gp36-like protein